MDRKQAILEVLATELETRPGSRITTALLARAAGVSEAALYRHFPSKARMFEGLLEFAEDAVFTVITRILEENKAVDRRCEHVLLVVLRFAERNPGIARLLCGDVLVGEHERLRDRAARFFDRIETQLRQVLREATLANGPRPTTAHAAIANLLASYVSGQIQQFVRSEFRVKPTMYWEEQWRLLALASFVPAANS